MYPYKERTALATMFKGINFNQQNSKIEKIHATGEEF